MQVAVGKTVAETEKENDGGDGGRNLTFIPL